jgi:type I restriction enzyme S subunit
VICDTEEKVTEQGVASARLKRYPKGAVLIAMYGQGVTRGKVGILGIEATTNQACAALVSGPTLNSVFLFHQLKLNYDNLRNLGRGGNQPNLNGELVKGFQILVPPIGDQRRFVEIAEAASASVIASKRSLKSLEEVFTSLQSRAFLGQL